MACTTHSCSTRRNTSLRWTACAPRVSTCSSRKTGAAARLTARGPTFAIWTARRWNTSIARPTSLISPRVLIDGKIRLDGELLPGVVLALHQRLHLVRRGGARLAAHRLELALHLGHRQRLAQCGVEPVDDRLWQVRRAGKPGPGDHLEARNGRLGDGRHVGENDPARPAGHRERAELALLDARVDRSRSRGDEIDFALQKTGESRRLAAIGNVQELGLGLVADQLDGGVQDRADAGRAVFQFAGVGVRLVDHLLESLKARVRLHGDHERIEARNRNPAEVIDHLELDVLGERRIGGMCARQHQQVVTVGLRPRDGLGGKRAGEAGLRFHHDRLAKPFLHLVTKNAGDDVDVAAGRKTLQQVNDAVRIGLLRVRPARQSDQHRDRRNKPLHHESLPVPQPVVSRGGAQFRAGFARIVNAPKRPASRWNQATLCPIKTARWEVVMSRRIVAAVLAVGLVGPAAAVELNANAIAIKQVDELPWRDPTGAAPVNQKVLFGDPAKPGYYMLMNRFQPGNFSKPHFHPNDRFITVLKGTWYVGTGNKWDKDATVGVKAGGAVTHYGKEVHYDGAKDEEVIVLITGQGPATMTPVEMT